MMPEEGDTNPLNYPAPLPPDMSTTHTSRVEAQPPDHAPPIESDDELNAMSTMDIAERIKAHRIMGSTSKSHAIELLGNVRDSLVAIVDPLEAAVESVVQAVVARVDEAVSRGTEAFDAEVKTYWDKNLQAHVPVA